MALHGRIDDCLRRLTAGLDGRTKLAGCTDSGTSGSTGGSPGGGSSGSSSAGAPLAVERFLSLPAGPRAPQQADPPLPWLLLDLFKLVEPRDSASLAAHRRQVCKEVQNAARDKRTGLRTAARLFGQISKEPASCRQLGGLLCVSSSMRQLLLDSRPPTGMDTIQAAVWQQFAERASALEMRQRVLASAGGGGRAAAGGVSSDKGEKELGQEQEEREGQLAVAAQQALQALHACTHLAVGEESKQALAQHGQQVAATLQVAVQLGGRCTAEGKPRLPSSLREQASGALEFWMGEASKALAGLQPQAGHGWRQGGGKPASGFTWQRGFLTLSGECGIRLQTRLAVRNGPGCAEQGWIRAFQVGGRVVVRFTAHPFPGRLGTVVPAVEFAPSLFMAWKKWGC